MKIRYLKFIISFFISSSMASAAWDGAYIRSGLGTVGYRQIRIKDDHQINGDFINVTALIELSGGWGQVIKDSVYLGIDAQLGNLGLFYYGEGGTSCYWSPTVQGRVGLPFKSCMPYIAAGIGYVALIKRTVKGKEPEEANFSWSCRIGCDVKITEEIYLGIYWQLVHNFNQYHTSVYDIKGSYGFSLGGLIGFCF